MIPTLTLTFGELTIATLLTPALGNTILVFLHLLVLEFVARRGHTDEQAGPVMRPVRTAT